MRSCTPVSRARRLIEFKGGHTFFLWENDKFTEAVSEFLKSLG